MIICREVQSNDILYRVFKYFTDKQMVAKEGHKFSCDFLIYEGDPLSNHSKYMVNVGHLLDAQKLVELGRIANYSNKILLIAYESDGEIRYKKIEWLPGEKRDKPVQRLLK